MIAFSFHDRARAYRSHSFEPAVSRRGQSPRLPTDRFVDDSHEVNRSGSRPADREVVASLSLVENLILDWRGNRAPDTLRTDRDLVSVPLMG
jgi:hypothetical protein